jgi:hypothetical protein
VEHSKEPPLKAAASDQQRLLDVQALDTRLDQLAHRRRTLPEHAALAELETELGVLRDQQVEAETEQSDLARGAEEGRGRRRPGAGAGRAGPDASRSRAGLLAQGAGEPAARDRDAGQPAGVTSRRSCSRSWSGWSPRRAAARSWRPSRRRPGPGCPALTASRDTTTGEIDAETENLQAQRATQAGSLAEDLVALYEKIREQQGGVGAAELRQRRCGGCRLELNNVEINELRDADPDEVMRCDECRRILVRTAESGL